MKRKEAQEDSFNGELIGKGWPKFAIFRSKWCLYMLISFA
jgi:hypothetical protein